MNNGIRKHVPWLLQIPSANPPYFQFSRISTWRQSIGVTKPWVDDSTYIHPNIMVFGMFFCDSFIPELPSFNNYRTLYPRLWWRSSPPYIMKSNEAFMLHTAPSGFVRDWPYWTVLLNDCNWNNALVFGHRPAIALDFGHHFMHGKWRLNHLLCNLLRSKVVYVLWCPNNLLKLLLGKIKFLSKTLSYCVTPNNYTHQIRQSM